MVRMYTCVFLTVLLGVVTCQGTLDANQCLTDGGTFNQTSKLCQCKPEHVGVGDLCCNNWRDQDNCFIAGDPVMTSVRSETAALNIPCAICIAVVEGKTRTDSNCVWEVLSSATIQKQGAMYNSIIKVGVSISKKKAYYFTLDGKTAKAGNSPAYTPQYLSQEGGRVKTTLHEEDFYVGYDSDGEFWTVEGCSSKVTFRPFVEGSKKTPGVCLQVRRGTVSKPVSEGNLCSLNERYPRNIPWPYKLLSRALNIRQMFDDEQRRSHADYDAICQDSIDPLMATFCQGISESAAQKCGPILYNSVIRSCLYSTGMKGPAIASLFGQCLRSFCEGSKAACAEYKSNIALQKCVPSMLNCETWPYYF